MNLCSNRPQIKTVKDFVGINQRNWYNWYMCFDCRFKTTRFEITDTITVIEFVTTFWKNIRKKNDINWFVMSFI